MKQRFLVVDDSFQTTQFIEEIFAKEKEDIEIITTSSANTAIDIAWKEKPDIIILNRILRDLNGLDALGILRKNEPTRSIPLIMLSDEPDEVENEINALSLGADDYINKPFNPEVFRLRIKAVLRRYSIQKKETEAKEILKSDNIILDMTNHTAYIKDQLLDLTPKEFALLYLFIKKKNRALNRVFLSGTIWEHEYFDTSRTIDKHIANLRKKLGPEGKRIETLPTVGYRFSEKE